MRALCERLKQKDIPYRTDVNAATLCTFRIGGTVALVIEPRCEGELCEAASLCRICGVPFEILGNGSNVLFEDGYLFLAVIRTAFLDNKRLLAQGIYAGCGARLPQLCYLAARHGLGGLQPFCGIPATLGGALAMNAGAHGKQLSDLVRSVRIFDLEAGLVRTDFDFKKNASYRNSGYKDKNSLFLGALLALEKDAEPRRLLDEMQRLKLQRRASQPVELPSAGCVFKRPKPDLPIGKLLDELSCKGMRVGNAEVSNKHAAFIVNRGGASAADVKELIQKIKEKAEKERGMVLSCEIRIISDVR